MDPHPCGVALPCVSDLIEDSVRCVVLLIGDAVRLATDRGVVPRGRRCAPIEPLPGSVAVFPAQRPLDLVDGVVDGVHGVLRLLDDARGGAARLAVRMGCAARRTVRGTNSRPNINPMVRCTRLPRDRRRNSGGH